MYIWQPAAPPPEPSAEEAESTNLLLQMLDELDFSVQPGRAASPASISPAQPPPPDATQVAAAAAAAAAAAEALQFIEAEQAKTDTQRLEEMLDSYDYVYGGVGGSASSMAQSPPRPPPRARSRSPPLPCLGRGVIWSYMRSQSALNIENMTKLVQRLLRSAPTCPYTLGISTDPEYRFSNGRFGYKTMNARCLIVLGKTTREQACALESELIETFRGNRLCRNIADGGGGVALGASIVYLYLCLGGHSNDDVWVLPKKGPTK